MLLGSYTEVSSREVLNISPCHEGFNYNSLTTHVTDSKLKPRFRQLVEEYHPNKTEDSGLVRLTPEIKQKVNEIIADWKGKGIVRDSISDYASPIVVTKRKNGDPHLCVNY